MRGATQAVSGSPHGAIPISTSGTAPHAAACRPFHSLRSVTTARGLGARVSPKTGDGLHTRYTNLVLPFRRSVLAVIQSLRRRTVFRLRRKMVTPPLRLRLERVAVGSRPKRGPE